MEETDGIAAEQLAHYTAYRIAEAPRVDGALNGRAMFAATSRRWAGLRPFVHRHEPCYIARRADCARQFRSRRGAAYGSPHEGSAASVTPRRNWSLAGPNKPAAVCPAWMFCVG